MVVGPAERRGALNAAAEERLRPAGIRIDSGPRIVSRRIGIPVDHLAGAVRADITDFKRRVPSEFLLDREVPLVNHGIAEVRIDRAEADVRRQLEHVRRPALREGSQERIQRPLILQIRDSASG